MIFETFFGFVLERILTGVRITALSPYCPPPKYTVADGWKS